MRVTLNIDGDLADSFKEQALLLGKPFGQVVNDALRRGVSFIAVEATEPRYRVVPNQSGLAAGVDPMRLNQLNDQLSNVEVTGQGSE